MLQIDAVGLDVMPAQGPAACCLLPVDHVQRPLASIAAGSLEVLVSALGCCFDAPCNSLLRLALLLSTAAAGVQSVELSGLDMDDGDEPEEDGDQDWKALSVQRTACTSRAQVGGISRQCMGTFMRAFYRPAALSVGTAACQDAQPS
jgi:hypothetical protein